MRQIKFRIWNTIEKEMITHFNGARIDYALHYWETHKHVSSPMQYTGLKDKNGVEIYEGDIIKAPKYERILQYELSRVSFKDGAFCLYTVEFEYHEKIPLCDVKIRNIEVVGNIYENTELLEV